MAVLNGVNYASSVAKPQEQIPAGEVSGKKRVAYDSITLSAELAIGDIINVCSPLPANARITDAMLVSGALGAGVTAELGHSSDADYFIASGSLAAAAKLKMASEAGLLAKDDSLLQPQIKIGGAASTSGVGKVLQVLIEYVLE